MKKFGYLLVLGFILLTACGTDKSEILIKDWKATDLMLGETPLSADDLGGIYMSFKADSSFAYTETGSTSVGKWVLNNKENTIDLTYKEGDRLVVQNIVELSAEKLIVNYEDHGMKRSITYIPNVK